MSKWIIGFAPCVSGSYLVKIAYNHHNDFSIFRLEFDSKLNRWYHNRNGHRRFFSNKSYYWWDEYGITESKRIKKLKF